MKIKPAKGRDVVKAMVDALHLPPALAAKLEATVDGDAIITVTFRVPEDAVPRLEERLRDVTGGAR